MLGFRSHFLKRPDQDIFWSKISGHIVPKKEHIFHKINIILKQYFWNFFVRHFFYHFSLQMLGRIRICSFLVRILGKRPRSGSPTLFVVVALTFNIKGKKSTDATSAHIVHIAQRTTAVNRHCVHTSIIVYFGAVADKNNSILLV